MTSSDCVGEARFEAHRSHETKLGALSIDRALPVRNRRLIGPWCFLDRFGPLTFAEGTPMDVGAHPHMGLQTVSWLMDGEVVHYDTLGNESLLRPGGVNIMTAGAAIAHAERTPERNSGRLNGVQLWIALPDAHRSVAPSFEHIAQAPALILPGGIVQVFCGTLEGASSPATRFSNLLGADLQVHPGESLSLPLLQPFEHGALILSGDCAFEGQPLHHKTLYYLGASRSEATFTSKEGARLLLIGGPPFGEKILMWWNFVARTAEEIRSARDAWQAHERFGSLHGYKGPRIPAPDLMRLAEPNPMS